MSGNTSSGGDTQFVVQATVNQTVTFTSKNPTDSITYQGVIQGIVTVPIAEMYGADLLSYTAAVQRIDSTVGAFDSLNYFLITLANGQTTPSTIAFANEWISSFSVVENTTVYNLNVFDIPANGVAAIITLLKSNNYDAVQVTNPSAGAIAQGSTVVSG